MGHRVDDVLAHVQVELAQFEIVVVERFGVHFAVAGDALPQFDDRVKVASGNRIGTAAEHDGVPVHADNRNDHFGSPPTHRMPAPTNST
ncbi:hypothetical protein CSB20_05850 [bacterium DOLZORAL124_64_63]|nr:MAG: hypothetical protein CSB20_05850 [bacterium DOLZORAL124_64_63]